MCTYREKRGDGWSETLYKGAQTPLPNHGLQQFFVTRLSHGPRVIPCDDLSQFKVESRSTESFDLPMDLLVAARDFYDADKKLREGWDQYLTDLTNTEMAGL